MTKVATRLPAGRPSGGTRTAIGDGLPGSIVVEAARAGRTAPRVYRLAPADRPGATPARAVGHPVRARR